jgi:hypothetical protein
MNYHLLRLERGAPRVRVQVWLDEGEPVESVVPIWPTADWHEREAWDLMGIRIEGHPNLRRILMEDDWEGHPLRKDYPIGGEPFASGGVGQSRRRRQERPAPIYEGTRIRARSRRCSRIRPEGSPHRQLRPEPSSTHGAAADVDLHGEDVMG